MYKKLLACGMALLMCGCSAKAAGNDQVLTVGLSSEMNGTFSPMYYQTTNDSYVVDLVYQGLLKYNKKGELVANVIKLRNGIFEGNTKNVLLFFFVENLNFFVDIQIEMCGLLSFLIIGQLFIGICFWRYL